MLCPEEKRFSAEQVLDHPWFTKFSPPSTPLTLDDNLSELKNYKKINDFKRFILTCLATRLNDQEIKDLKDTFCNMDINKDGTLTLEEIKKSLKKYMKENEIEKIFKEIDINNSNKIEYTEFISSLIAKKEFLKEEKLMEIFKTLDKDGNGKITKEEIKKVLNAQALDANDIKQFILKFDLNGDGQIDYYEFVSNMNK